MSDATDKMIVVCDSNNDRLTEFNKKYEQFFSTLSEDEKRYVNFISYAADVAFAEHGQELTEEAILTGGNMAFEKEIEAAMGQKYIAPQMTTFPCVIRTTVMFKCATWLLKC